MNVLLRTSTFVLVAFFASSNSFAFDQQELHWMVCNSSPKATAKTLGLEIDSPKHRSLAYFETQDRSLDKQGAILRARWNGNHLELTAKLRFDDEKKFLPKWANAKFVKCENDESPTHIVYSCSIEENFDLNIDLSSDPSKWISRFSDRQKTFFIDHGVVWPDADKWIVAGPVDAYTSDISESAIHERSDPLAGEWKSEDFQLNKQSILKGFELSVRPEETVDTKKMSAWIETKGVTLCPEQVSKTTQVLDRYIPASKPLEF